MIGKVNIAAILRDRAGQPSFHTASEKHVRIEFRILTAGEAIGPFTYDGDLVITCYRGVVQLQSAADALELRDLDQVVVPSGARVRIECTADAAVQIIWAPAQATTQQG